MFIRSSLGLSHLFLVHMLEDMTTKEAQIYLRERNLNKKRRAIILQITMLRRILQILVYFNFHEAVVEKDGSHFTPN